jgi:hypothetical protein
MRRSPFLTPALTLLFLLTSAALPGRAAAEPPRTVLTDKEAVVVGPAQILAMPTVTEVAPHPEGRYVLVVRQEADRLPFKLGETGDAGTYNAPGREVSIALWSSRREKVTTVWRRTPDTDTEVSVWSLDWLPGTANALGLVQTVRRGGPEPEATSYELVSVNAAQGSSRTAAVPKALLQGGPMLTVLAAPSGSPVLLQCLYRTDKGSATTLYRLDATTGVLDAARPAARLDASVIFGRWLADGKTLVGARTETGPDGKRRYVWMTLDPATGTTRDLPEAPKPAEMAPRPDQRTESAAAAALPLRLATVPAQVTESGKGVPLSLVYLEAATPDEGTRPQDRRTLVAADARTGEGAGLLPDGSAALYFVRDTLFVAPLRRADRAAFLDARRAAWRREMVANAKQLDSALQQYALDNKGVYPPPGSDIRSLIVGEKAYIKRDTGFYDPETGADGFTYTYTGRKDAQGRVSLFTLRGAGGTITIYAEGGKDGWDDGTPL